ncbi:MarR family winged helix-turn-helix transcriptional regulator [Schleiferilactobacillus perolens]|jgi:DNA-binding MarR family transcriptional regulator|uniref:Transcriptional regulator OhrR n=1 Tax=Schleiferilactobacillus perolens DSM 12744 TaxID=1423792 RepID=A0A0R1N7L1_9LACO|nr:MarR family transcriptional regulator [Schleiferilactobacillus perolens]KRL13466.1 transcriptional regulator OhrR [Schleiferilactobacillus perolens DSM 12744]MCI2170215.1 MarR family transcriptional regulator [Schleiferilactobacillus perolens]
MATPIILDQQLCFSIYQAHKVFNHFYTKALAPFSLTYSQYIVLLALWQYGTLSVKDLGARVGLDSGTLTPLLKRLEKDGWLTRSRSKNDERKLDVALTDHGQAMQEKVYERVGTCLEWIGLSADQYAQMRDTVLSVRDHLADIPDNYFDHLDDAH